MKIFDLDNAQYNNQEQIAICYYNTTNPLVEVSGGTSYKFITKNNICLAWVEEYHVQGILNRTKKCCGNNAKHVFRLASEADVRRWTDGGR